MAKKATKKKLARGEAPHSNWKALSIVLGFVGMLAISIGCAFLVFSGMLPTLVARLIDRSYQHAATICVGCMNFCGLFPYLLEFWNGPNSFVAGVDIAFNPITMLAMYAAAAFGWILFLIIPPIVVTFLNVLAQRRVATLRSRQREIIEEWGEGIVKAAVPPSKMTAEPAGTQPPASGGASAPESPAAG